MRVQDAAATVARPSKITPRTRDVGGVIIGSWLGYRGYTARKLSRAWSSWPAWA